MTTRYFTNSYVRRDQEQYAVKLKMPKGSLAPLKKCNLNVNLYNLAEVRALSKKFSKVAPLSLTKIYFGMSASEGAKIDEDALCDILDGDGIKKHEEFISYCLDKSLIKLFREISPGESREKTISPGNETGLPDIDYDNEYESIKLIIAIPEFLEPKTAKAIERWKAHRQAIGKPFDQMALDSLINLYQGRASELAEDIDHSISNGWKTLNAKSRETRAGPSKQKHNSSVQKALDLAAKYEAEGV